MNLLPVIIVIAATFGICFLADKAFTKLFRGKAQHQSGLSVKASKRYATIGLVVGVLGIVGLFSASSQGVLMLVAGIIMVLLGVFLITYFLSFGIYYDDDSFIYSSFGRKSRTYMYKDITAQQLYTSGANLIIELHLSDEKSIQLQSSMSGVERFLNKAFDGWLDQRGLSVEDCAFHDPQNSRWFPSAQED